MNKIYRIIVEPRAKKELDLLAGPIFMKVDKEIKSLAMEPRRIGSKKLDGDIHRIRVRSWRVIYSISDAGACVFILRISRRNEKTYKILK